MIARGWGAVGAAALLGFIALSACSVEVSEGEGSESVRQALVSGSGINFVKTADWGAGYTARLDITNGTDEAMSGWVARFDMPPNVSVALQLPQDQWEVLDSINHENEVRIAIPGHELAPGETLSIYVNGEYEGEFAMPTQCRFPAGDDLTQTTPCDGSDDLTPPTFNATIGFLQAGVKTGFFFGPGSDDTGVTGYLLRYHPIHPYPPPLFDLGEIHTHFAEVTRLNSHYASSEWSGNYEIEIRARDAAGNLSTPLYTKTFVVPPPQLEASFSVVSAWEGGFQGEFTLTNTLGIDVEGWSLRYDFDGTLYTAWNGELVTQVGNTRILAPSWDRVLEAGSTVTVGVVGAWGDSGEVPSNISVNLEYPGQIPLAVSHAAICSSVNCPSGFKCVTQPDGYPACVMTSPPTTP